MDFVGPWEVKFESRDDAICAKRVTTTELLASGIFDLDAL